MKSQALRIIKYAEVHEDVRSHRLKSLKYVQMPVGRESDGWEALGVLTGGLEAKGAYLELVEFAASCPVRGLLASEDKPFGKAILARRCRMTIEQLEAALELLMHEEVGFIDYVDWPVDPRLIDKHEHQGRPAGQTITSHSIDADGHLIACDGHLVGDQSTQNANEYTRDSIKSTQNNNDSVYTPTQNKGKSTQKPPGDCISAHNLKPETETEKVKYKNPETEKEKGDVSGGDFSDSNSASASGQSSMTRSKGYQRLLLAAHGLFAPRATSQYESDRSTLDATLWPGIWPEDISDAEGAVRLEAAIELANLANRQRKKVTPMRWFTGAIMQRINGKRPWAKDAKAGAA